MSWASLTVQNVLEKHTCCTPAAHLPMEKEVGSWGHAAPRSLLFLHICCVEMPPCSCSAQAGRVRTFLKCHDCIDLGSWLHIFIAYLDRIALLRICITWLLYNILYCYCIVIAYRDCISLVAYLYCGSLLYVCTVYCVSLLCICIACVWLCILIAYI